MRRSARGFTLVEMVIALALAGIMTTVLTSAVIAVAQISPNQSNKLTVTEDLQFAQYWLARDSAAARTFVAGTAPTYGTYSWFNYTGSAKETWEAVYSYDSTLKSLIRTEKKDSVTQQTFAVARNILNQSDVTFTYTPSTLSVVTSIKSEILDAPAVGDFSRTAALTMALRPRSESAVAPPADVPVPTPVPGAETYTVASVTLVLGAYVSGNAASFASIDSSFYVADSAASGSNRFVEYLVESQTMALPATIGSIEVRWTGKSNQKNVSIQLYVQDSAAGFPATADLAWTFTEADTNTTRQFSASAAAATYINGAGVRKATLKVRADAGTPFRLSTDQILFFANP